MSTPLRGPVNGRLLVLDTGPIRELVLFHAVHEFRFERLRRELTFITHHLEYAQCGRFIASFQRKVTTASVVAELHSWIRDTDPAGRARLWNPSTRSFARWIWPKRRSGLWR